jgi:two-component system chemotaxis sensor kinase CheA
MSDDANLLSIFWGEVGDYLQTLNNALLQIETGSAPDQEAVLREMNRVAHSMKGAARAVGIGVIEKLGHYMEDVFEAAYKHQLTLSPAVCDLLYDSLDMITNVVNGGENDTAALAAVIARLEQTVAGVNEQTSPNGGQPVTNGQKPQEEKPVPTKKTSTRQEAPRVTLDTPVVGVPVVGTMEVNESGTLQLRPAEESVRVSVSKLDRLMGEVSELLVTKMHAEERARDVQEIGKLMHRWGREWRAVRTAYIRLARRMGKREEGMTAAADDSLLNELGVLFKFLETNQRHIFDAGRQMVALSQAMAQFNAGLGMLAEQIQDDIGSMRLVPFDSALGGFQRMVRDLARDTDKNIHLDVIGATVELDKTALDALKEPIMHLLRNAVDHGLETPGERERMGKSPTGRIVLAVEQRGKEITVRISDDGRGLDSFRIGRAAVQSGLLTTQEAAALNEDDIQNLIFYPGLTTNEKVTSLSGRGMGMDIVRTRVEGLRGRVSVQSVPGKGTTFSMVIPLSLTRLSCVLLRAGGQDFAVPSVAVLRMLRLPRDQIFTSEGREMVTINEQPMPLAPLGTLLGVGAPQAEADITMMVLTVGERAAAFEVDDLMGEQELVLKPLGMEIAEAPYVSGAALLGTGEVVIVLDPNDLIRGAGGLNGRIIPREIPVDDEPIEERPLRVLVVDDSITTRTLEKHILESAGFKVQVAVDGLEAWGRLNEMPFDLVIADVEMPNMTGLELTQRIKTTPHTQHTPVILLTSLAKPEQREAGMMAGADAYLVKSRFDQVELLRTIRAVV